MENPWNLQLKVTADFCTLGFICFTFLENVVLTGFLFLQQSKTNDSVCEQEINYKHVVCTAALSKYTLSSLQ